MEQVWDSAWLEDLTSGRAGFDGLRVEFCSGTGEWPNSLKSRVIWGAHGSSMLAVLQL